MIIYSEKTGTAGIKYKTADGATFYNAPMGYSIIKKDIHHEEIYRVLIDETCYRDIIFLFKKYASGEFSSKDIKDYLRNNLNLEWNCARIIKLLSNRFYVGIIQYKGKDYPHNYPLFIDKDLFEKVQDMIEVRRNKSNQSDRPTDNISKGLVHKALMGECPGQLPYGYKYKQVAPRSKYNSGKIVVVNESEIKILQEIFEIYATGKHSCQSLTDCINEKFGTNFHKSSMGKIISNKFYMGIITLKGIEYPHNYPTFISKELFEQVSNIRKVNNRRFLYADSQDKYSKELDSIHGSKIKNGHLFLVERGDSPIALPMGYIKIKEQPNNKHCRDHSVVLDEKLVPVIRDIFEQYVTGKYTCNMLSLYITKKHGINIVPNTIRKILRRKFYIGIMIYAKKEYPHYYPRIINEDLFYRASQIIERKDPYLVYLKSKGLDTGMPVAAKVEIINSMHEELLNFCFMGKPVGDITEKFGISIDEINDILFELELEGKIKEVQPRIWQAT